jgi:hypothetical protein
MLCRALSPLKIRRSQQHPSDQPGIGMLVANLFVDGRERLPGSIGE